MAYFALKIFPIYLLISLGWLAGRYLRVSSETIASLLIYIIAPIVFFGSISRLTFSPTLLICLALPCIPAACALVFMRFSSPAILPELESRIVASVSAVSNGGYFGIPLYVMFFGEEHLGIWMLFIVGSTLFESTAVYYQLARSNFSIRESVIKLLKLPLLWSALLGLACSAMQYEIPQYFMDLHREFRGAYLILGMMIIGVSLSTIHPKEMWSKALCLGVAGRLVVYPAFMIATLTFDSLYTKSLSIEMRDAAYLFGFLPVAANTIVYAEQLQLPSALVGSIVFTTTILCTLFSPILITMAH